MNPIGTMKASCQETMDQIRENNPTLTNLKIGISLSCGGLSRFNFTPTGTADFAELGDAIANSTHLERFEFDDQIRVRSERTFFDGLKRNSSIYDLRLSNCHLSEGTTGCEILRAFGNNGNLTKISLRGCHLENGGDRVLALALSMCKNIKYISVTESGLSPMQLVNLVEECKVLDQLKAFELSKNQIGRDGCVALAMLLRDPNCSLLTLCLSENNIDDDGATILADALKNNRTLKKLYLDHNSEITGCGWDEFYQVLCNTSTINATCFSNHTLTSCGFGFGGGGHFATGTMPDSLSSLLGLNKTWINKKQIAMKKILRHHPHFNMEPLFEWDLKVLPFIIGWFDRAKLCGENNASIDARKLDAIYQFTKATPMIFVKVPPRTPLLSTRSTLIPVFVAILSLLLFTARDIVIARQDYST